MKNMKQILIGAFSFITSCVMLTIILPIIDNINLSFMRVCIYLLLVVIISLFCFFLFKKYKLNKGYFILAILPFIISVCMLPIGWVVQHENRKNYAYITINGQYRKINVVGKLNPKDPLYQERFSKYFNSYSFRPVGMYKVKGITQTERLGSYIPSIYDTDTLEIQPISDKSNILDGRETKIDYIIDYIGSYYLHLKKGELFEGVGMVEEIYYKGQPTGRYRLSLNPWDGHMINHMYLKTIHKGENRRTINDHLVVSSQKNVLILKIY